MRIIVDLLVHDSDFPLARQLAGSLEDEARIAALIDRNGTLFLLFERRDGRVPSPSAEDGGELTHLHAAESTDLYLVQRSPPEDGLLAPLLGFSDDVIRAEGQCGIWRIQATFDSPNTLDEFLAHCREGGFAVRVDRRFRASRETGPWFGVTPPQRNALLLACEEGYYDIPRRASTADLAERLDISDQAVTERLRRGIQTLVANTLQSTGTDTAPTVSFGN